MVKSIEVPKESLGSNHSAPFPWFGVKRKVGPVVWKAFGKIGHYIEPFFGSGAVLLARPEIGRLETVNDKDHWIVNFWRALQNEPDEVYKYANYPEFEDDITARHIYLVKYVKPELEKRIPADMNYYNAKAAGLWLWGISTWIGRGWGTNCGPWTEENGELIRGKPMSGISKKRGQVTSRFGVHIIKKEGELERRIQALANRMRTVRVLSGDWSRLLTTGTLCPSGYCGIFLDPPYSKDVRGDGLYEQDEDNLASNVFKWCLDNGSNPKYRVALCGYDGEHNKLEEQGWTVYSWVARPAYPTSTSINKEMNNSINRKLERIWFSPACLSLESKEDELFETTTE